MSTMLMWSAGDGERISTESFRAQAVKILRAQIISGGLERGVLHSIGAIAEKLDVSITPVREALHDLAKDGLIEMRRNRGFIVRTPSSEELDEIDQIRTLLEVPAVRQITAGALIKDFAPHRQLCRRNRGFAIAQEWEAFVETDRQFHLGLLSALGNARLVEIVGTLRDQSRLLGLDQIAGSDTFDRSLQEHEDLLDAMQAGDPDRAAEIMSTHLRHVRGLWAGLSEDDPHAD